MKINGPFFVKNKDGYELAPMCLECAFGDYKDCALRPCIFFQFDDEDQEEIKVDEENAGHG